MLKCIIFNGINGGRDRDLRQTITVGECVITDRINAGGNGNRTGLSSMIAMQGVFIAIIEDTVGTGVCSISGSDIDRGQAGATYESGVGDRGDILGNRNLRQTCAVRETAAVARVGTYCSDLGNAVSNGNGAQI